MTILTNSVQQAYSQLLTDSSNRQNGTWELTGDNYLSITGQSNGSIAMFSKLGALGDFTLEWTSKQLGGSYIHSNLCPILRYTPEDLGIEGGGDNVAMILYLCSYTSTNPTGAIVLVDENGNKTDIRPETNADLSLNSIHSFKLVRSGSTLTFYEDDTLISTTTNLSSKPLYLGWYLWYGGSNSSYQTNFVLQNYRLEGEIFGNTKKYYFKANFQNTLEPQVGTFSNEGNKTGLFTHEGDEYYLTNNTNNSYRLYGCSESTQEKSYTIEFDLYYPNPGSGFKWILLCAGDDPSSWWGIATRTNLVIASSDYGETILINKINTWLHVKIVTTFKEGTYERLIYIDDVLATAATFANKYFITKINILGDESGYKSDARLKNLEIYSEETGHHYLDKTGLKQVWKNIKDYHEASLSNYYTKEEVDALINSILTANTSANSAEDIE